MPLAAAPHVGAASYQPRAMEGTVLHESSASTSRRFDGVFAERADGTLEFHAAVPPSDEGVARCNG